MEGQACQDLLVGWTQWVQGSACGLAIEGGRAEQERYHWILRGEERQEAVAGTKCVGTSSARSILCQSRKIIQIG